MVFLLVSRMNPMFMAKMTQNPRNIMARTSLLFVQLSILLVSFRMFFGKKIEGRGGSLPSCWFNVSLLLPSNLDESGRSGYIWSRILPDRHAV